MKGYRGWLGIRAWTAGLALIGVSALVVAGCGGGDESSDSGDNATTADNGQLCVSSLVGYAIVPDLLRIWEDTAKKNGLSYTEAIANPEGDLQSAQSNVESCAREKAKVAVNITTPDETVAPSIQKIQSDDGFFVGQYSGEPIPGQAMSIGPDDAGMSQQLFDFAEENLLKSGETPTVFAITSSAIPVVVARVDSFVDLAEEAGWNVVGPVEIPPVNVAQQTASKTAAALRSNPDINMMLAFTDEVTAGATPAIKDAGADVSILAYEGLEPTYSGMRAGNSLVKAVASAPIQVYNDLQVWAVGQMLAGDWENDTVADCLGVVVTPESVPEPGTPNKGGQCDVNGETYTADQLTDMAAEVSGE